LGEADPGESNRIKPFEGFFGEKRQGLGEADPSESNRIKPFEGFLGEGRQGRIIAKSE
jgi:hypothetical protein